MKKLLCILAAAALVGACQKTEDIAPATRFLVPDNSITGQKPRRNATDAATSLSTAVTPATEVKSDAAAAVESVKTDAAAAIESVKTDASTAIDSVKTEAATAIEATKDDAEKKIEAATASTPSP